MNFKKTIFFLISGILSLVVLYNFVISPMLYQNNYSMGMGMHMGRMYNYNINSNSNNSIINLGFIVLIITGLIIAAYYIFRNQNNRCPKCGYDIKNQDWRICPVCGTKLKDNGRRQV